MKCTCTFSFLVVLVGSLLLTIPAEGRYYDPRTGRFLQEDPIGQDGGINQYPYVDNNPVNNVDPEGLLGIPSNTLNRSGTSFFDTQPNPNFLISPRSNPSAAPPIPVNPPIGGAVCEVPLQDLAGTFIEEDCHLIDRGPSVCIYQCETSGQIIRRSPPVPGQPESCPPVIKNRTRLPE